MVRYCYITRLGQTKMLKVQTFNRALYMAATNHEEGCYIDYIYDNGKKYNHDEVLLLCHKQGLL